MNTTAVRDRWIRRLAAYALLGAALLLSGCAAAPTPTSTSTSPRSSSAAFACQIAMAAHAVDTVVTTLTCRVTGAPTSDTSFAVTYTVKSPTGVRRYAPDCSGLLSGGRGSCVARYWIPAPVGLGRGFVSGAMLPDQRPLGPVTPQLTPAPSPSSPFATPWPGGFPTITPQA